MTSPIFYFLFSIFICLNGALVCRFFSFYRQSAKAAQSHRYRSIDGLRGFLAFGVFVHHAVCYYFLFAENLWDPKTAFYAGLGSHFVSLFFMITGFLFWSKVIHARGRLPIRHFFTSRAFRILPMYYVSTLIVLVLIGFKTNWQLLTTAADLTREIFRVLAGGLYGFGEINKSGNDILNGVFWTLRLEWRYYIFLPFLALIFYGSTLKKLCLGSLVLLLCVFVTKEVQYFQFVIGGLAAEIVARGNFSSPLRGNVASVTALVALASVFFFLGPAYSWPQTLTLAIFFIIVANGNSLFGLLLLPTTVFLGTISYSVYLIHTSVLFIYFSLFSKAQPMTQLSTSRAWILISICGSVVLLLSALTYRFVEAPFIEIGKRRLLQKSA